MSRKKKRAPSRKKRSDLLSQDEITLFVHGAGSGTCQALYDHPLLEEQNDALDRLAFAACRETDKRKRAAWVLGWVTGYKGVLENDQSDPQKTASLASLAKSKTHEENLLFYQEINAYNLAQLSSS